MSKKIIGGTVCTPVSPYFIQEKVGEAGYATKKYVQDNYQPKGDYLTENDKAEIIQDVKDEIGDGVNVSCAVPGQMIIVKTVDGNGKPTEWEAIDRTHGEGQVAILPETYLEEGAMGGSYAAMLGGFILNLPIPLMPGKTYFVAVNGVTYTATAVLIEDEDIGYSNVSLNVKGVFDIYYYPSDHEGIGLRAGDCIFWYNGCEDYENMQDDNPGWIPATLSINGEGILKLDIKYLDMDAIKAALPAIDLTATLEDGTTKTYKLYGEAVEK